MATKQKLSFAKSFEELEEITAWFERGETDLDEGLKKFERGLELAAACKEKLGAVENRIEELKVKFSSREE